MLNLAYHSHKATPNNLEAENTEGADLAQSAKKCKKGNSTENQHTAEAELE